MERWPGCRYRGSRSSRDHTRGWHLLWSYRRDHHGRRRHGNLLHAQWWRRDALRGSLHTERDHQGGGCGQEGRARQCKDFGYFHDCNCLHITRRHQPKHRGWQYADETRVRRPACRLCEWFKHLRDGWRGRPIALWYHRPDCRRPHQGFADGYGYLVQRSA